MVQTGKTTDIGPIWFLVALFWGQNILIYLMQNLNKYKAIFLILLLSIMAIIISDIIFVPFSILQGISALPFLLVGYILKDYYSIFDKILTDKTCVITILTTWIIFVVNYDVMRISYVIYPLGFSSIIISLAISLLIFRYSYFIDCNLLQKVGKHTLLILCVHTVLLLYVQKYTKKLFNIDNDCLYTILEVLIDVIVTIFLSFMLIKIKSIVNGNISKRS